MNFSNYFVFLQEKSKAMANSNILQGSVGRQKGRTASGQPDLCSSPVPNATLDLSRTLQPHELSTLV